MVESRAARHVGTMSHETPTKYCPSGRVTAFHYQSLPARVLLRAIVIGSVGIVISGISHALLHPVRDESEEAARLVASLIEENATTDIVPNGFEDELGYLPASWAGTLVSPRGGCSTTVVAAPEAFDNACRIHDLGYDTLRFAERSQIRLGPWARFDLDLQLYDDLLRSCQTASCRTTATAYFTAVTANSIRQGYGSPTDEPVMPWVGFALAVVGLSILTTPGVFGRLIPVFRTAQPATRSRRLSLRARQSRRCPVAASPFRTQIW